MEGLLYINDVDVYKEYGAFLAEERADDTFNQSQLLALPTMKPYTAVNIREENGERLPETLIARWEPRFLTLQFAIGADNGVEFLNRRRRFVDMLRGGWLNLRVTELGRTYRVHYVASDSYDQITGVADSGGTGAIFRVKFREPLPE